MSKTKTSKMSKCSLTLHSKDPPNKSKPQPKIRIKTSFPNLIQPNLNLTNNKPLKESRILTSTLIRSTLKSSMTLQITMICKHKFKGSKKSRMSTKNKKTQSKNLPKSSKLSKVTLFIIQVKTEASNSKNSPTDKTPHPKIALIKSL